MVWVGAARTSTIGQSMDNIDYVNVYVVYIIHGQSYEVVPTTP